VVVTLGVAMEVVPFPCAVAVVAVAVGEDVAVLLTGRVALARMLASSCGRAEGQLKLLLLQLALGLKQENVFRSRPGHG
jgi:hypothetical protein